MTMNRLTTEDFRFKLLDHALMLQRSYIRQNKSGHALIGAQWIIRSEAWREFQASADFVTHVKFARNGVMKNELLGLPVRVTIDDQPETPMVQLVFEPLLEAHR